MIKIGTACAVITPPAGTPLCGYPHGEARRNTGVSLDLKVKALTLDDGARRVILLCADLIGMNADRVNRIRKGITDKTGIPGEAVLISCSHTHSGPHLHPAGMEPPDTEFLQTLEDAFVQAGSDSSDASIPVTVGVAEGEVDLCHNRRVLDENGKASSGWQDPEHQHTGPVDKRVSTLVFRDREDRIRALLANYACHPVVMGPESTRVSADYPGYLQEYLEGRFPGVQAMFTNAGGGNINPCLCIGTDDGEARRMGERLGAEVERTALSASTREVDSVSAQCFPVSLPPSPQWKEKAAVPMETEVQMLRIGRRILIVTAPGELLVETGRRIREQSPFPETLNFAYTNDSVGYLPPPDILDQGGYEVESARTHAYEPTVLKLIREKASGV